MNIDELKSTWQQSGNEGDLPEIKQIKNHPKVVRLKIKFGIETILLLTFLASYHEILDGGRKPLWLNILLVASLLAYVANNAVGYRILINRVHGPNIVRSLQNLLAKLRRTSMLSMIASVTFSIALIGFLTFDMQFTGARYAILAGMIATLGIATYTSYRKWESRLNHLHRTLVDFIPPGEKTKFPE